MTEFSFLKERSCNPKISVCYYRQLYVFPLYVYLVLNVPTWEQMQLMQNYVADLSEKIHSSRCRAIHPYDDSGAPWFHQNLTPFAVYLHLPFASTLAGVQNRKCFDVWLLSGWGLSWEGEFHKANSMTVPGLSWRDLKCCLCRRCAEVCLNPCLKPVFLEGALIEKLFEWLGSEALASGFWTALVCKQMSHHAPFPRVKMFRCIFFLDFVVWIVLC